MEDVIRMVLDILAEETMNRAVDIIVDGDVEYIMSKIEEMKDE